MSSLPTATALLPFREKLSPKATDERSRDRRDKPGAGVRWTG